MCVIFTPVEINETKTEEAGNWAKNLRLNPTFPAKIKPTPHLACTIEIYR